MIILDTDCLSLLERKTSVEFQFLSEKLSKFAVEDITTTIVTFDEQMRGWMAIVARSRSIEEMIFAYERLESFVKSFRIIPILPFDDEAGRIFYELKKQKLRLGTMDLRIAAIAISQKGDISIPKPCRFRTHSRLNC